MTKTRNIVISFVGIGLAIVVTIAIGLSFWVFRQIDSAAIARQHSHLLITMAENLMAELTKAESSQRGYSLTNEDIFLEPYNSVRTKIVADLHELQQLTHVEAAQAHVNTLVPLVSSKLAEVAQMVELHRNKDLAAEIAIMNNGSGRRLSESIAAEKNRYVAIEEDILAEQDAQLKNNMHILFIAIVAASSLLFFLALVSGYLMYRETKNQLKKFEHRDTKNLLKIEEAANKRLHITNLNLQLSQEKLEVTLKSIGDGVMVTDANARVTLLNPVAERLTGWSQTEATDRSSIEVFNIVDHETRLPHRSPVAETLSTGSAQALANHTILIARDTTECFIEDSCAPIHGRDGTVIGSILVFRDITKRRETEDGLEKASIELNALANELQRTVRVKSEFLANMSHELRTPLNSIIGFSEALYDELFGPLNEKQKKYMHNVLTSGNHLLLLINQILDMARVESGKMTLSLSVIPIGRLLHEMVLLVEHMVSTKNLRVKIEIDENLPEIEADELKVREVLYNLLSNAIKFTPSAGSMGMQAKQKGAEIEIMIWDTGVGIAKENMEKIFEGFFRVDTPYSQVTEGTGLGLPISRKLVELHGGTLSVESEGLQKGTSVRFTLPIKTTKII